VNIKFDPSLAGIALDTTTTNLELTGSGLDVLVEYSLADPGLNERTSQEDIIAGATAAARMNMIVVEAIVATGAANDGAIKADDVYAMSDWIAANRLADWVTAHGDDGDDVETGFHLIQNDGGRLQIFGDDLINQVADGIYHLGFGHANGRLINEDGDANAEVDEVAFWLNSLLSEDLIAGTLANDNVTDEYQGTTGTGLDQLVDLINDDPGLERRVSQSDIKDGAQAADVMNAIIIEGIETLGLDLGLKPTVMMRMTKRPGFIWSKAMAAKPEHSAAPASITLPTRSITWVLVTTVMVA